MIPHINGIKVLRGRVVSDGAFLCHSSAFKSSLLPFIFQGVY